MDILNGTWADLLTLSGLLNPPALLIGLLLGRKADAFAKIWIAGFAAAALSLMAETGLKLLGVPLPISQDAGALAMFPFRFIGGAVVAFVAYRFFPAAK
ncbi:phosphatidylglycerophosphatase A [Roseibium sp. TrichSKD4]|uniref:hypothetical protein n=1 Tax=Roseibium sp. TrichSKD4 TaxID=744980 RepID=UPI0001E5753C|nr:hypothetical protein [Roseibium sp. TrichSKD4]EFO29347.1 phosphatidylglycerophosphatase A [Roseibium sp. TrichSKD4]